MTIDKIRFSELVHLYLEDKINDREGAELDGMLQLPAYQAEFEGLVSDQLKNREFDLETPPDAVHDRIQAYLDRRIGDRPVAAHRVRFIRSPLWKYAAAIVVLAVGIYFYQRSGTPALLSQEQRFRNDIRPGGRGATLTLADGKKVMVTDSLVSLADRAADPTREVHISTGKGESYSLVLSDGTKVWLNSSSSLRCPAVFTGNQRKVELSGEAYFEVRHDARRPFSVRLPDGSLVKDLGTRFNIQAYADEPAIRTTLLEGAVEVEAAGRTLSLKPGEQAEHSDKEELTLNEGVNVKNAVAWKDEQFQLEATNIRIIMQEVERWYNAEVVYQDGMESDTIKFFGSLPRNVPVSQLLKVLESTGHVHFTIEGKKITVMK